MECRSVRVLRQHLTTPLFEDENEDEALGAFEFVGPATWQTWGLAEPVLIRTLCLPT